jgi:DNA-binding CsgD family transcriptional regulator
VEFNANIATALVSALRLARQHGGAQAALQATGIDLPDAQRFEGLSDEVGTVVGRSGVDEAIGEALALGFLAGRVAHRPRVRTALDPTSFIMDRDLFCVGAEGESIMRLPWFDDDLFVGRQIPDISEMPAPVRSLCVEHYSAALQGERGRFSFMSYGHAYSVDAVPVNDEAGRVQAVLGIATPARPYPSAAQGYDRTAERLESSAEQAERRAELHRLAGRAGAEAAERQATEKARRAAERARVNARRLRLPTVPADPAEAPSITPREAEVLQLASHGLTYGEIAEQLAVTVATVRTHIENIHAKLGVSDKAAAVAAALRHGLIE